MVCYIPSNCNNENIKSDDFVVYIIKFVNFIYSLVLCFIAYHIYSCILLHMIIRFLSERSNIINRDKILL